MSTIKAYCGAASCSCSECFAAAQNCRLSAENPSAPRCAVLQARFGRRVLRPGNDSHGASGARRRKFRQAPRVFSCKDVWSRGGAPHGTSFRLWAVDGRRSALSDSLQALTAFSRSVVLAQGNRRSPDVGSDNSYDAAPETPPLNGPGEHMAVMSTVMVTAVPGHHPSSQMRVNKDGSVTTTFSSDPHGIYAGNNSTHGGSRTSTSTTDSQGSHGQIIYAKPARAPRSPRMDPCPPSAGACAVARCPRPSCAPPCPP